jgi:hypothetical protein
MVFLTNLLYYGRIQSRIWEAQKHTDQDPQHWLLRCQYFVLQILLSHLLMYPIHRYEKYLLYRLFQMSSMEYAESVPYRLPLRRYVCHRWLRDTCPFSDLTCPLAHSKAGSMASFI